MHVAAWHIQLLHARIMNSSYSFDWYCIILAKNTVYSADNVHCTQIHNVCVYSGEFLVKSPVVNCFYSKYIPPSMVLPRQQMRLNLLYLTLGLTLD